MQQRSGYCNEVWVDKISATRTKIRLLLPSQHQTILATRVWDAKKRGSNGSPGFDQRMTQGRAFHVDPIRPSCYFWFSAVWQSAKMGLNSLRCRNCHDLTQSSSCFFSISYGMVFLTATCLFQHKLRCSFLHEKVIPGDVPARVSNSQPLVL